MFPAASRAVEKRASLLVASWMTGWRDPRRERKIEKERRGRKGETRGAAESKKEKRGEKKRKQRRRRRSSIYHPAKWARWTGLETCRLGGSARAQPTVSDDKAGSATLQRDVLCCDLTARFSRAFGCAIILHPARINQR